jgi:hypothetical protein
MNQVLEYNVVCEITARTVGLALGTCFFPRYSGNIILHPSLSHYIVAKTFWKKSYSKKLKFTDKIENN